MPTPISGLHPRLLRLATQAEADFDEITLYLNATAGRDVALIQLARLQSALQRLAALGHGGAPRSELGPGLRLTVHKPYSIYFRQTDTETIIIRILHGKRLVTAELFPHP